MDRIESCGRRLLVAHSNPPEAAPLRELTPQQHPIVRRLLEGESAAGIASELGTARSTVSEHADCVLRKLRLRSVSELVMVGTRMRHGSTVSRFELGGIEGVVIDAGPLAEAVLWSCLSPAERHVAALVLDGLSTSEIAGLRRSAYRTVANQLASIYEKLGVNSRLELGRLVASAGKSREVSGGRSSRRRSKPGRLDAYSQRWDG